MVSVYMIFALAECHMSVVNIKTQTLKQCCQQCGFIYVQLVQTHFHSITHSPHRHLLHNRLTYYINQSVTVPGFRSRVYIQNCTGLFTQ